jgi:alanine-synthesizing transaminase
VISRTAFSTRLPWHLEANALSDRASAYRQSGKRILDLTLSNPTTTLAEYPHAAIALALAKVEDFGYAPDAAGEQTARAEIQRFYAARGVELDIDQVFLTASTSEAYALLFKLLCDPGDEVLTPTPSYPLFEYLAGLESVRPVPYPLGFDGAWFMDEADLASRISARTKAIVIVNPNNPTGSYVKKGELAWLFTFARRNGLAIISDEVFSDFALTSSDECVRTLAGTDEALTFCLNGLSKGAGMPQMKLGWIVLNGGTAEREAARRRLDLILDTFLSVNTPVQRALRRLLEIGTGIRDSISDRIRRNLTQTQKAFEGTPAQPLFTEAGWTVIVRLPNTLSEEEWVLRFLERASVLVQPGYFFDLAGGPHFVLSLISREEDFDEGLASLRMLVLTPG